MVTEGKFIPEETISREHDLAGYLCKAQRQQHASIMLDDKGLDDDFFTGNEQRILSVKKVSASSNELSRISALFKCFPKAEILALSTELAYDRLQ